MSASAPQRSKRRRMQRPGNTALHLAAEAGHAAIVRMLLQHGVNADTKGDFSWTALMYAIGNGHSAVAEYLLAAGANPNAADKMGQTPLLMAAQRRQKACAACIYRAGGRYGDELISAVLAQNTTELEQLLRNGANPNSCAPRRYCSHVGLLLCHSANTQYAPAQQGYSAQRPQR